MSEWGGGPEIVALATSLSRPFHVYESRENSLEEGESATSEWAVYSVAKFGPAEGDRNVEEPVWILSTDSRFPDLSPKGRVEPNHFMWLGPSREAR